MDIWGLWKVQNLFYALLIADDVIIRKRCPFPLIKLSCE